nr:hypothetical protein [Tanacetum cinerariifolium]
VERMRQNRCSNISDPITVRFIVTSKEATKEATLFGL